MTKIKRPEGGMEDLLKEIGRERRKAGESSEITSLIDAGEKLFSKEDYVNAISYYNKVLDLDPEHIDALAHKGYSLCELGRYKESADCFDYALKFASIVKDSILYFKGASL